MIGNLLKECRENAAEDTEWGLTVAGVAVRREDGKTVILRDCFSHLLLIPHCPLVHCMSMYMLYVHIYACIKQITLRKLRGLLCLFAIADTLVPEEA